MKIEIQAKVKFMRSMYILTAFTSSSAKSQTSIFLRCEMWTHCGNDNILEKSNLLIQSKVLYYVFPINYLMMNLQFFLSEIVRYLTKAKFPSDHYYNLSVSDIMLKEKLL